MNEKIQALIDFFKEITSDFSVFGIVTEVLDIALSITLLVFLVRSLKVKFKNKRIVLIVILAILAYLVAFLLNMNVLCFLLKYVFFWTLGIIIIIYSTEIRHIFDKNLHENTTSRNFNTTEEKNQLIDTLVNTAKYLSERKTGALITIEGKDSLDSIISKAIPIDSRVSLEILSTIFYVGTVTHDGGVIIRKNIIKCAGAYLPSTDRYDIPKDLGTRHRAAIGLSEHYDAITVVVSEETGAISVTVNGGIERGISEDRLKELLNQYIIVQ